MIEWALLIAAESPPLAQSAGPGMSALAPLLVDKRMQARRVSLLFLGLMGFGEVSFIAVAIL